MNTERGAVLCQRKMNIGGGTQYPSLSECHAGNSIRDFSSSLDGLATEYERTIVGVVEKARQTYLLFFSLNLSHNISVLVVELLLILIMHTTLVE